MFCTNKLCYSWNAGLCLRFSEVASCSTEEGYLCFCHWPAARSRSSWLPCRQALQHTRASLGIWFSIWSEAPRGSRACKPAVGAAGKADLEGRLWQAGETAPRGKLHVFHWEGSWQTCLLHGPAIAIYRLWAVRVRLPACGVSAVVKHQIFVIFLSVSIFVLCESTSCLKKNPC